MGSEDGAAFLLSRAVVLLNSGASDAEISVSWETSGIPPISLRRQKLQRQERTGRAAARIGM